uniref:Uncharacterized protein n=1 Tax=Arundo donax TaxID=35708 RepID=A0A0A9A0X9_ARUDO
MTGHRCSAIAASGQPSRVTYCCSTIKSPSSFSGRCSSTSRAVPARARTTSSSPGASGYSPRSVQGQAAGGPPCPSPAEKRTTSCTSSTYPSTYPTSPGPRAHRHCRRSCRGGCRAPASWWKPA